MSSRLYLTNVPPIRQTAIGQRDENKHPHTCNNHTTKYTTDFFWMLTNFTILSLTPLAPVRMCNILLLLVLTDCYN